MNPKPEIINQTLSVSADLLLILIQQASQLGITRQTIEDHCQITIADYLHDESRVPLPLFNSVWSFILYKTQSPNFGLQFGIHTHNMLKRHLLYALMMNCKTAGQAIEKNFLYHNLITDVIKPKIQLESSVAVLTWQMNRVDIQQERHFAETILSLFATMLRYLTEDQVQFSEIRFSHKRPKSLEEHQKIFSAPLRFSQPANEIILQKRQLEHPILLANSHLLDDLEKLVQKALHRIYQVNSWSEKVSNRLAGELLKAETFDIESIAFQMGLTGRNLQIKLKKEGTTYRDLLDSARKEIACSCLKDPHVSNCEIALLLGFSDQSAFHHAFKRWTGETPGTYRKNCCNPTPPSKYYE
jgi:AraC-like DNA-binding protein